MTRSGWYFVRASPKEVNIPIWASESQYNACKYVSRNYQSLKTPLDVVSRSTLFPGSHTSFQTKTSLQETNELIKVSISLVLLNQVGEFLSMNDEVKTTNLC